MGERLFETSNLFHKSGNSSQIPLDKFLLDNFRLIGTMSGLIGSRIQDGLKNKSEKLLRFSSDLELDTLDCLISKF
jgi:hypothetical protein